MRMTIAKILVAVALLTMAGPGVTPAMASGCESTPSGGCSACTFGDDCFFVTCPDGNYCMWGCGTLWPTGPGC